MHPILLSIGPIAVSSSLICLVLAWAIWSFFFWREMRNQAMKEEYVYQLMFYGTVAALIGSRLGFVVSHWQLFAGALFIRIFTPWIQPGLTFAGGFLAGGAVMLAMSRSLSIKRSVFLDAFTIGFSSAYTWGALGALLDGSVAGKPTSLPWGVTVAGQGGPVHPVPLYQMFSVFVILFLLAAVRHIRKTSLERPGMYALWFFFLFSLAQFCLEFLTVRPVYLAGLTLNQWVYIGIFAESSGALITWGGGKNWAQRTVPIAYKRIVVSIGGIYAAISKRHTRTHSDSA